MLFGDVFLSERFGQSGKKQRSIEMIKQLEKISSKGSFVYHLQKKKKNLNLSKSREIGGII